MIKMKSQTLVPAQSAKAASGPLWILAATESAMMERRPHPVAKIANAVMELVMTAKASSSAQQIVRAVIMSASSLRHQNHAPQTAAT
jgi:hypothetical protein